MILLSTTTAEEHLDHLQQVFHKLHDAKLSMKLSKCHFFPKETQYLGHVLSTTGIKTLPSKTAAITLMKLTKNAEQVRAFLVHVGYYLNFIKKFAWIAKPLTALTCHDTKFVLDIRSPCSIWYPQKCFERSTYPSLPISFKMLHSIHRCLTWCLWRSVVTWTPWPTTASCISLPHIHRQQMEMELYQTGNLWHLLCCNKV